MLHGKYTLENIGTYLNARSRNAIRRRVRILCRALFQFSWGTFRNLFLVIALNGSTNPKQW